MRDGHRVEHRAHELGLLRRGPLEGLRKDHDSGKSGVLEPARVVERAGRARTSVGEAHNYVRAIRRDRVVQILRTCTGLLSTITEPNSELGMNNRINPVEV